MSMFNSKLKFEEGKDFQLTVDVLISSIGSTPEGIKGLNYDRSLLKMQEDSSFQVWGFENVFAIGNAVTGKGNIQESKKHGKQTTKLILDDYLTGDLFEEWLINQNSEIRNKTREQINSVYSEVSQMEVQSEVKINEIVKRVESIYEKIGFVDYEKWIKNKLPVRLEDILKNKADRKCL